ncbi:MAG TPA: NADH-quinone oxidoreductase subunit J [Cellulomonas sp.]
MVIAAGGLLFARKAVHAALSMIVVMIGLAFLYVAQDAAFLGVVQVVVYTGAVMMLFLFVLMLVGVDSSDTLTESLRGQRVMAILGGLGLAVVLVGVVGRARYGPAVGLTDANADSNPVALARLVFGSYAFAFEIVGALLITAAVGALALTHRRRLTPRVTQRERAEARVKAGTIAGKPAPGVYARHNAMDVPALDPNGQPIEASVSRVLRVRGQEADAEEYAARIDRVLAGEWAHVASDEASASDEVPPAPDEVVPASDEAASAGAKEHS